MTCASCTLTLLHSLTFPVPSFRPSSELQIFTDLGGEKLISTITYPVHKTLVILKTTTGVTRAILAKLRGVKSLEIWTEEFDWSLLKAEALSGRLIY